MSTERAAISIEEIPQTPAAANRANRTLVLFSFFSIWIIWGSTYLAIRYAVETIPPLYTAGLRHLTAGTILLLWCVLKGRKPTAPQIRASIVIGGLFFLIGHGSLHWAETRVPSGLASLLVATEPIFVFVIASAAARRWRMNATLAAGVLVGLGGVALLMGKTVLAPGTGMMTGAVAVLIGALGWSAGIIYSRRSQLSGSPLLLSAMSLLSGSTMLLATGTVAGEWRGFSFAQVTVRSWLALAYLIVFGSVIAFTAYNWLLERYSPTLVATHTYVNPIVAVLLGWIMAGERITLSFGIAASMVVGAVVLVDCGISQLERSEKNAG